MKKYWVLLVSGSYGYVYADHIILPGEFVTIVIEHPDYTLTTEWGQASSVYF